MGVLISAHKLAKTFGIQNLFKNITFSVENGQKIGLIGPNGAGKTTLLQIIAQKIKPDAGDVSFAKSLVVGYLEQNPTFQKDEIVIDALLSSAMHPEDASSQARAYELISKLGLEEETEYGQRSTSDLSGGWLKRVALARELMKDPNLLLLDEPTNHLDVVSIQWLEEFLSTQDALAYLIITHDRLFLQNTCDMIFDLDIKNPEGLIRFGGTYADFLDLKDSLIGARHTMLSAQKNTLRRETEWLRRGAKARQTKQTARIDRAHDLKDDVQNLKFVLREKVVTFDFGKRDHNPKKIIELENVSLKRGEKDLFKNFTHIFGGRARTGLLGANGSGKTSLIKLMLQEIQPTSGVIKITDGIELSYFSQKKEDLNPELSVLETICPYGDYVQLQGQAVYAKSYLSRFHFRNDQMDLPVGKISGGEQSRLLLAQLMLGAKSVLILDEPTNDLDIETLDSLQEALAEYPGAVILVSHDRFFMDQVCTEILAIDEKNHKIEKFANVFQWTEWIKGNADAPSVADAPGVSTSPAKKSASNKKLSFKEQHEFDTIEETIQKAEKDLLVLEAKMSEQALSPLDRKKATQDYQTKKESIDALYGRWEHLNALLK